MKIKTGHGGKRPGAGRPKGSKDAATKAAKATLAELAKEHTEAALSTLVSVMKSAEATDSARVAAANSILDRGYGKPLQESKVTVEKRDATDWTRDELVAFLRDARDGGDRVAAEDGRGGEPGRVH